MATKKDLIEAQGFSRRRLLSAFTGGAPGDKELEPAQPLRAVVAGIALTALLVLGGVFYGLVRPGLPTGWENNHLILASDTGARYISVKSVLYPVINTASARLLVPANKFAVITTDQKTLGGIKIGPTVGILGAPDHLPAADQLITAGWSACVAGDGTTAVALPTGRLLDATPTAAVVSSGGTLYVIAGELRYEVDSAAAGPVLRAVGLDTASAVAVDGNWLNLFQPGITLKPIVVAKAGQQVGSTGLAVGTVVHPRGAPTTERYLITSDGQLATLGTLAYQLYLLGTGANASGDRDVSPADIASLPTSKTAAGGSDWPVSTLTATAAGTPTCALLTHTNGAPHTKLGALAPTAKLPSTSAGVRVASGRGALVNAGGSGSQGSGMVYVIDESGTAYPVPGANAEVIARLGYTTSEVMKVPQGWVNFMPIGPALTEQAAGASPKAPSSAVP